MPRTKVEKHFDEVAKDYDYYKNKNSFYYKNLKKLLSSLIPKEKSVYEVGCGTGDLLASLKPRRGYGMDISDEMITIAKSRHKNRKNLFFTNRSQFTVHGSLDYIFMSDVIEHLENPKEVFNKISKLMTKNSIFINTMANPIWEPILMRGEKLGAKMPEGPHKRITNNQLSIFIEESGMKITKHDYKLLMPIYIPFITNIINKYLEKPLRRFAFIEYIVAVKV